MVKIGDKISGAAAETSAMAQLAPQSLKLRLILEEASVSLRNGSGFGGTLVNKDPT